jgi:hypothetical protein
VQGVVDPPVPGARKPVADLVTGGHIDRRGAVIAGESVLGGEPGDVTHFGQNPPGDHRADAEQAGQASARRGGKGADLAADVGDPRVQGADAGQMVTGDKHADLADLADGADPGQQRLCFVRRQLAAHPAWGQPGQQPVQPAHRLSAQRGELVAPVTQQPQAHQGIVTGHREHAGAIQCRQADRDRVALAGLAAMPTQVHPHPGSQLRRHIQHQLAIGDQPLGQRPARPTTSPRPPSGAGPSGRRRPSAAHNHLWCS